MKSTMPVMVYGESTPNPNILKFVFNFNLLPGSVEYLDRAGATASPLAQMLFSMDDVRTVFISSNFISITKSADADWYELMPAIREAITAFFREGKTAFAEEIPLREEVSAELSPVDTQIIDILEEYVRPAVEGDGGEIVFKSFVEGKLTLIMKGACRGCPSSTITLKSGIETLLKQMVPEVKEVVAEAI